MQPGERFGRSAGYARAVTGSGRGGVHGDRVPMPGPAAVGGLLHDGADDLVAEQHRRLEDRLPRRAVLPVVQVGAADAAVGDLDDGLVGRRGSGTGDGFDAQVAGACATTARVSVGMVLM